MQYFSGRHLLYAIPALIVLVTIVIPPPLLLLSDPFLLWLEDILTQRNLLRGHHPWTSFRMRLKPVFDAFQGCFKDKFRFFAGLFFLYRIIVYIALLASSQGYFYYMFEFILICILVLQGITQPFEKQWDNVLACLCLGILTAVNTITITNFFIFATSIKQINFLWVQTVLISLPLIYAVCSIAKCVWEIVHEYIISVRSNHKSCEFSQDTFLAHSFDRKELYETMN